MPAHEVLVEPYSERLTDVGAAASVGPVADSYDAMTEALNGSFKAEAIEHHGLWRDADQVVRSVVQRIAWYNTEWLQSVLRLLIIRGV